MRLRHVGLACSSEKNSDKFYRDLLRLEKSGPKILPRELVKAIFNLDDELQLINYMDTNVHFEIFIHSSNSNHAGLIEHSCLDVGDLESFLQKCRAMGVEISQIPKGEKILTFVRDYDGNLFEIKES
jgi:catechol 2,3-dioxygenase-like lactoylglutathione lyase family enzyme